MPRLSHSHLAALFSAIAAVCVTVGDVKAQVVAPDPLAPSLNTDPRNPPKFQKFTRSQQAPLGAPTTFTPPQQPPSAAGNTGFDSTNSRKAKAAKAKPKTKPTTDEQAIQSQNPTPAVSPYQKPFPTQASKSFASAPGEPPVPDMGPIRRKPTKRRAHVEPDDPYAQLGIRAGGITYFPAVELTGGRDSNPGHTTGGKDASFYTVSPELRAQSDWSRHELKSELRGSYTGFSPDQTPTLSRPYFNGTIDGRVDVTRDTRVDLGTRLRVGTDNPGSPNLQAGLSKLPVFVTNGGNVGLGQKFNRFDVSIKGDAERTSYQDSTLTDGSTASNKDRNYDQYAVTLRGGYELSPGVTPFVEVSADTRKHDLNADLSGYQRDSKGLTGKVGSTFELSRLLTGEVAVGYTRRNYEDPRLNNLSGLIGNASLVWTVNALTSVKLSAASTVGESTIAGVSGVLYRDVGLQVDHSFRRWLIGSAKIGFGIDSYKGADVITGIDPICGCIVTQPGIGDRQDKRFSAGLGLTYKLSRTVQVKGEFRQDWLRSNVTGNDYTASIFMLGVRLQQ
ncbi:MAG TPA: outer membrane beta-barrel protein [Pseudolabrys sp.]